MSVSSHTAYNYDGYYTKYQDSVDSAWFWLSNMKSCLLFSRCGG